MDPNHYSPSVDSSASTNHSWLPMHNGYNPNVSGANHNPGWANGMPPSGPNNGMNPMMQQFAMANLMSNYMMQPPAKPIGSQEDDSLLVKTLREAESTGRTYKQALDSLHTQNGHSAAGWKDYYLDHATRINELIQRPKAAKKPIFPPSPMQPKSAPPQTNRPPKPQVKPSKSIVVRPLASRRSTGDLPAFGSSVRLASHASRKLVSGPVKHRDLSLPPIPSRSPSPPTIVVQGTHGNKFTADDKEFFVNLMLYELHRDPSLTKSEICSKLAEKAPHHSYASWGSYWTHNPDPADKILDYFHEEDREEGDDSEEESDYEQPALPPLKIKREVPKKAKSVGKRVREEVDQDEMGRGGGPITKADKRALARHIASREDWTTSTYASRWKPFSEKFPQRSPASWAECYRRYKSEVDPMVPKYRQAFDSRIGPAQSYLDVDAEDNLPRASTMKRVKMETTD